MDKEYLKGVVKYIISALISIVIIAYIAYHLTGGFTPAIETSTAIGTSAEKTLTASAIIMRNEQIAYSTVEGNVNYLKSDGTKVSSGTEVAEIFSANESKDICQDIISLNNKIKLLESSNMSESERRSDTTATDEKISNTLYSFINYSKGGNMSSALSEQSDLLINLNQRRIIIKSVTSYNEQIKLFKDERDALYNKLTDEVTKVHANNAGYFYSYVDGYESVYSSNRISLLTYQDFQDMKNMPADDFRNTGFGYPVGKLVTDYLWYIACEIDYSEVHNFTTNTNYSIRFPQNNDETVKMYLYRILYDVDSKTAILIFRGSVLPSDFNYARSQTVQIVVHNYSGYRIPTSSVHIVNGQQGVYILKGTKVHFRYVDPIFEYDGFYIVSPRESVSADSRASWLNKNDLVITKGKGLYDGKIVD